ncbi:MAG: hypothetical protein NC828_06205, partial [Candidatus Omnitrophica bacterium]|nr:hypothetical protein [Candidatus Omnitrophota bacterium]
MKAKNTFTILIFAALFAPFLLTSGFALNNQETSVFIRANVYYEQANYDEAIKQYNSILEIGWESGNLYYNLGNGYFRLGMEEKDIEILKKSAENYQKALEIDPNDK